MVYRKSAHRNVGHDKVGPGKVGSSKVGPGKVGSSKVGPHSRSTMRAYARLRYLFSGKCYTCKRHIGIVQLNDLVFFNTTLAVCRSICAALSMAIYQQKKFFI